MEGGLIAGGALLALIVAIVAAILLRRKPAVVPPEQADKNLAHWIAEERRFRLALEQCQKGPERKAELRSRLKIAQAGVKLAEMRSAR